jgi:hypothetical protein
MSQYRIVDLKREKNHVRPVARATEFRDHRRLIAAVLPERYLLQGRHEHHCEDTPCAAAALDRTKTSCGTLIGIN